MSRLSGVDAKIVFERSYTLIDYLECVQVRIDFVYVSSAIGVDGTTMG